MRFRVEPMRMEHIATVGVIERRCFSQPWPPNAYRKEIQTNRMAHYFVARRADGDEDAVTARVPASAPADLNGGEGILGKLSRLFRGPQDTSTIAVAGASPTTIVGYAGLWLMTDEAHITTIAVDPEYQGHGIGELLLLGLIDRAKQIGARWLTLEVRVTNTVAQTLYQKYTFKEMGVRRRYYSDNGEDALVMWTDPIESETFQNAICRNREALGRKLAAYE
jgi:ribosomal-protein-alanine N-acetyltransferase